MSQSGHGTPSGAASGRSYAGAASPSSRRGEQLPLPPRAPLLRAELQGYLPQQPPGTPGESERAGGAGASSFRKSAPASSAVSPSGGYGASSSRRGKGGGGGGGGGASSTGAPLDEGDMTELPATPRMAAAVGAFETLIWGTDINVKDTLRAIEYFIRNFRLHDETLAVRGRGLGHARC